MFGYENYIQGVNQAAGCDASYVHSVLNPSHPDAAVRIPEPFGRPSSVAQIKMSQVARTSLANSQFMGIWNPVAILNQSQSLWVGYGDGTAALNVSNFNTNININSVLTGRNWTNIASACRLVSAELRIQYIGRADESSGILMSALVPETLAVAGANILDKVRDGYFYYAGKAQEGIRCIYMPQDNRDVEYNKTGTFYDPDTERTDKHNYYIIGYGLPPDKAIIHVEMTYNVEYIPDMSQIEYVPTGVSSSTLLEESLQKITQLSKNTSLVNNKLEDFDFSSVAGSVVGGVLGSLLGGKEGGVVGANVGYQAGPFLARGQENDRRWAESILNSKAKWYDGPLTKFFN